MSPWGNQTAITSPDDDRARKALDRPSTLTFSEGARRLCALLHRGEDGHLQRIDWAIWFLAAVILGLIVFWLAPAHPNEEIASPACRTIWTDSFPVASDLTRGNGRRVIQQDISIAICREMGESRLVISGRLVEEIQTPDGTVMTRPLPGEYGTGWARREVIRLYVAP